jgi:folate-binding protein YgfZ
MDAMPDVTSDYVAMRREAGAVDLPRDIVRASGPDAASFLQGQLSQDVEGLLFGHSAWSFVLQPQGKIEGFLRVTRLADDDDFLLDTEGGWGEALVARLERFKLRTKVDLAPLAWRCLAVRGPQAHAVAPGLGDAGAVDAGGSIAVAADWPGLPGVDILGPEPFLPEDVRRCSLEAYENIRIEAGIPALGRELTERTIPQESGIIDRAVSFTKGCYTGQELVARIDSRGHVNRHLRGIVVADNVIPPPGAEVVAGDKSVGELTSVGESLDRRAPVALAYIRREVELPTDVVLRWDGGTVAARVEALPLVGAE